MARTKVIAEKVEEMIKETTEKKAADGLNPAKKTITRGKSADPVTTITIQFGGQDLLVKDLISQVKKSFKKTNKGVDLKKIDLYIKPEEAAVYYVANGKALEDYKIEL